MSLNSQTPRKIKVFKRNLNSITIKLRSINKQTPNTTVELLWEDVLHLRMLQVANDTILQISTILMDLIRLVSDNRSKINKAKILTQF